MWFNACQVRLDGISANLAYVELSRYYPNRNDSHRDTITVNTFQGNHHHRTQRRSISRNTLRQMCNYTTRVTMTLIPCGPTIWAVDRRTCYDLYLWSR